MSDEKPLLTAGDISQGAWENRHIAGNVLDGFAHGAKWAERTIREGLRIGKLRVVGTVKRLQVQETPHGFLDRCSGCSAVLAPMDVWCPGCGEKIEP